MKKGKSLNKFKTR